MTIFFDSRIDWAEAVNSGRKVHTVRPSERGASSGATLRMVTGRFTGRLEFATRTCTGAQPVQISSGRVTVSGAEVDPDTFAVNSGFSSSADMFAYYGDRDGYVIHWTDLRYP